VRQLAAALSHAKQASRGESAGKLAHFKVETYPRVDCGCDFMHHFPLDETDDMRLVLCSKIHKATITEANVHYVGSITVDRDLMDRAGSWPGEKVLVVSNTSGARLETYIIADERGSGNFCMNGAAALLIKSGEEIIIMGFELTSEPNDAAIVLVD
jgi:aspartate 1-decarboxylase